MKKRFVLRSFTALRPGASFAFSDFTRYGLIVLCLSAASQAQSPAKFGYRLGGESATMALNKQPGLRSNSISDVVIHRGEIWLGTGRGLSRSTDEGSTWTTFSNEDGLPRGGVSALTVSDSIIWVATALDSLVPEGLLPAGGGLSWSTDNGTTWHYVPQPTPFNTVIQNVTFDIALHSTGVWIVSWGGSVHRSPNRGQTWEVVPPDSFFLDVAGNLNHRGFSALNADGVLYIGTAGGINKSVDGGLTWTNFSHQNQSQPISGNFVVALGQQKWDGREYLWAATINAEDPEEVRAVSVSEDAGYSWRVALEGEFSHDFAFKDSAAYVVTDHGLFKSLDFGYTWARFVPATDEQSGEVYLSDEYFAVGTLNDQLWVGGPDGVLTTRDEGATWAIQRGSVAAGEAGEPRTYAYPNPFSPFRHNQLGGDGYVRFQYSTTKATEVTITVFDFAMTEVAAIVNNKPRLAPGNYSEIWNAKTSGGKTVANGVYFYRVDLKDDGTFWGKLMVLD